MDLVLQQLNEQNQQFVYNIIKEAKNTRDLCFKCTRFLSLPIQFRDHLVASLVNYIDKSTKLITLKFQDLSSSSHVMNTTYNDNYIILFHIIHY